MIIRSQEYLDNGMPTIEMVTSVVSEHVREMPRLKQLRDYYEGRSAITQRTRAEGLPNNKIAHPYARYITQVATGYLVGQPVAYSSETDADMLATITAAYEMCNMPSVDLENARNMSICGRGVEYVHVEADSMLPVACALKPEQAFVVYDDTHEAKPLFGVYFAPKYGIDGKMSGYRLWVTGKERIDQYETVSLEAKQLTLIAQTDHYFGDVPIVEYWNDEDERGDFEWVIPLIDAYDKLESDRVNDKEQLVDRLLLLTGCTLETDDRGRKPWQQLREDKALCLPDTDAKAEYLYNSMDESGTEVLRTAIVSDIHKMSMIPDLTDKDFAQNASGVAMKYKLWGLEQLTNVKEQWFIEGLRTRLKLFANYFAVRGGRALDASGVKISMTRSLPNNLSETASIVQTADSAGAVSLRTKVRMLHADEGWDDEMVEAEAQAIEAESNGSDPLMQFGNIIPGDNSTQLEMQSAQDQLNEPTEDETV